MAAAANENERSPFSRLKAKQTAELARRWLDLTKKSIKKTEKKSLSISPVSLCQSRRRRAMFYTATVACSWDDDHDDDEGKACGTMSTWLDYELQLLYWCSGSSSSSSYCCRRCIGTPVTVDDDQWHSWSVSDIVWSVSGVVGTENQKGSMSNWNSGQTEQEIWYVSCRWPLPTVTNLVFFQRYPQWPFWNEKEFRESATTRPTAQHQKRAIKNENNTNTASL